MPIDLKQQIKQVLPPPLYQSVLKRWRYWQIYWGTLRRVTPVCRHMFARGQPIDFDYDRWGDYWRFTDQSAQRLFGDCFGAD
jgi:hypothetical protein